MASRNSQPVTISRRGLLSAVSAASLLSLTQIPTRAFAANLDVEGFLALSQKTLQIDDLFEDVAAPMLKAFADIDRKDDLAALAEGAEDQALSNEIAAAWYSGVSPDPGDLEVITYTDALMWRAMNYTKPMAYCGGPMGYWADPPES
ncbi:MAG: sugar dehydrogenase complex small subunit [Sulfitobacter sp.]|uniref:sugar dehydrogenase complex small subunit n=1 Tax=Sulfitobacter sp. TaxID=1903071 RepID=UPI0032993C9B